MFRCYKHLSGASPLYRGLHCLNKTSNATLGPISSLKVTSARCLSTSSSYHHWRKDQELGVSHHAGFNSSQSLGRPWQSWYRQSSGGEKSSGGPNFIAIVSVAVTAVLGGILFMSSTGVTSDPSKIKERDAKKEAKKEAKEVAKAQLEVTYTPKPPPKPAKLPENVTYLIIGAGTAAMTASKTIRTNDPTGKVLMVTEECYRPYMRPPLSKELWFKGAMPQKLAFNDWAGKPKDIFYQPEEFYMKPEALEAAEDGGIALALNHKVTRLDVVEQVAHLADGQSVKYDRCLIATGGKPRNLRTFEEVDPAAKNRVHLFRNVDDFHHLRTAVNGSKSVTVVGGGFLGSELAVALAQKAKEKDLKVYQAFPEDGNMGLVFPEYLSKWSMEKVRKEGVEVYPGTFVVGCDYNKSTKQLDLVLKSGEKLSTDQVVVAVGLAPNVELANNSGLEVDSTLGGFLVNAELEARKNVWVAGDAACFYDISLGRRRVEHHDHAVVSGRLAGDNMTGQGKPYWHQSMFWSDLGPSIGYEAIGVCDSRLPTFAIFAKASDKDTPKAVVEETGEGLRSETETEGESSAPSEITVDVPHPPKEGEDYGKGVIFYTRDDRIVGVVLWNLFGRMPVARQVLKEAKTGQDLTEVAKLFDIHDQKKDKE